MINLLLTLFGGSFLAGVIFWVFSSKKNVPTISVNVPIQASPDWKPEKTVDGKQLFVGNNVQCFDPATFGFLGAIPTTTLEALQLKISLARTAQQAWKKSEFSQRVSVLKTLQQFILSNQQEISNVSSRDTGKTFVDAFFGEILTTLEKISWLCKYGESVLQTEYRPTGLLTIHKSARVEYIPRGVVAAIVSWNYPFHNIFGPITAALFAGNAIVVKCSEYVAWSTIEYYAKIIDAVLVANGAPRDLVQFVVGGPDIGEALVRSNVDKVTFIGSPNVGKLVMKAASDKLTPVTLELGGKDAAIICNDVDLSTVVPVIMRGTFQNMGQNCVGLERLVIQEDIHDKFIHQVFPLVKNLRVGPTLSYTSSVDCGAITMPSQLKHIQGLVDSAVEQGATLLTGGSIQAGTHGQFYPPTILTNVTKDMKIAQEEVFGPVMTILKFRDDTEAIDIVNNSPYGLGGSVFSEDISRAERIVSQLNIGMCNINDFGVNYLCQSLPFGGVKESGFDRFAGVEGLRAECVLKSITRDKISSVKTTIPPPLQYPLKKGSTQFCKGLAKLAYSDSLVDRASGVFGLLGALISK